MNSRDDNLKMIANLVTPETLSKILFKNYSDRVIKHICGYAPTIEIFANTKYKPETVEKLIGLMKDKKLDYFDLMELMKDSLKSNRNEQYIDTYADTVTLENQHDTYSVLRTTNFTDVSFDEMYLGIHQGVYEANNDRIVQMNSELASAINDMRSQPDWKEFAKSLKSSISWRIDQLTPYILDQRYSEFQTGRLETRLSKKLTGEYERYIANLKKGDADTIINSAYEIYNKKYIADYCNMNYLHIDKEDLQILLETDNVLDEIYQEWDTMTQFNGVAEIDTAIEDTAFRLRSAKAVKQVMEQKQKPKPPEVKPVVVKHTKPKKKGGAR